MAKAVDRNGYWFIPHNPISKVGVFDYLGASISDECEPNRIYKVFRSGETLLASVPTWDNPPKPFINDHEMLGDGFTDVDDRPVQGVITNPQYKDGVLYADLTVYSESLKEAIENGKKELSLGYFCKFEKQSGIYDGEPYDYVQIDMVGNHIALVDAGRCGSDVKVFDHKCVMDSFDITPEGLKKECDSVKIESSDITETKDSEMADKREFIRKIMAIAAKADSDFEGGEKEKIETIAKLLEESEYAKSEKGTANDEAEEESEKSEDKCGKDEEEKSEKAEDESEEKEESKDEEEKKAEDEDVRASDIMAFLQIILEEVRKIGEKKVADESEEKEEEAKDESESEKESEDEEEKSEDEKEEKETGDGILFTFGQDKATVGEDPAIKAYLA